MTVLWSTTLPIVYDTNHIPHNCCVEKHILSAVGLGLGCVKVCRLVGLELVADLAQEVFPPGDIRLGFDAGG